MDIDMNDPRHVYFKLVHGQCGSKGVTYGFNMATQPINVKIKLKKSKTERYYQYAKFQVDLYKSNDWRLYNEPWFFDTILGPEAIKRRLLDHVNRHNEVYNVIFKYVYDRCLETCDSKTLQVEIGRKHQAVSTNVLATEPYPMEMLWVYVHIPEYLRNKLNEWLNCSFKFVVSNEPINVHYNFRETTKIPCWDINKPQSPRESRFDWDSRWLVERQFSNSPAVTDKDFTFCFHAQLSYGGFHPDAFMPDYFTSIKPRPWTGEMVQVLSPSGDSSYCYLAALKSSSPVFEAEIRWKTAKKISLTLTLELSTEVFNALIEFINYSDFTAATKSFKLAVELLFAANKFDVKELQDKLLDWIYVLPVAAFDDIEVFVELYLLLDVTLISECVLKRLGGIVKLNANAIMSSPIFQDLEPIHKSKILSLINSYDVVLDIISQWNDNRHNTSCAKDYAWLQTEKAENTRIQAIHKRKPWQLCCDYLNYCNFKAGNDAPASEAPEQLIKIVKTYWNTFHYIPHLVMETT